MAMDMDPKTFVDVPLNTRKQHACSPPAPGANWHGVVIRAPQRVTFQSGSRPVVPVCGYFNVALDAGGAKAPMKLVAVDRRTGRASSGDVVELDPSPTVPRPAVPPPDPKDLAGMSWGSYFNSNLVDFVAIPEASGTYDVHVEFHGHKSNVVAVEVIRGT
jgi:hypothetical protein